MSRTLLVIPHYNDAERLEPFMKELIRMLPSHFSILVSDDGSRNSEREKLVSQIHHFQALTACHGPQVMKSLFAEKNEGKGAAIIRGWKEAEGFSLLAFTDADGAVSAEEIIRAESFFRSEGCNTEALFGSRVKMLGRSIQRSLLRHISGRIFATLVSEIGKIPVYDTQCGLKILTLEAYQCIKPYLHTQGFAFDVELALLLIKYKKKIIEFPIDWNDVPGSKVRLIRDAVRMSWQILKIKKSVNALQVQE
jgi:glycosyltransferase involved in cell wall biosynthesis